jgi:hypothetical protein
MELSVAIYSYIDENMHVIYAPSLDLIAHGFDEKEAKESFEIVLDEYLNYVVENDTFETDLKNHGWNVNIDETKFIQPTFQWLIENDSELNKILTKPYKKFDWAIKIPVLA